MAPRVAIIDELRRQERLRDASQSPVRRTLRGIARGVFFLLRPEYMTVYATFAAAIAAFLAVKAADRQERATFTSALYGKQVDILANIDSKLDRLAELISKNVREGLEGTPLGLNAYTGEIAVAATNLREVIYSAEVVYPKEAMLVLDEAAASVQWVVGFELNRVWGRIDSGPLDGGASVKPLFRASKGNDQLAIIFNNLSQLRECSKLQLRDGQNIDGPKLSACLDAKKAQSAVPTIPFWSSDTGH